MQSNPSSSRFIPQAARACSATAGALALAGLASWWFGQWRLVAFGAEYVPMAPSTALLMLLLSTAAFLRAKSSPSRTAQFLETGCGLLVLIGSALIGFRFRFGFPLPLEHWLSGTTETVGAIPVGRMSPLTVGCFVFVASGLLCGRVKGLRWEPLRSLGGWLALAVLAAGGFIVAGYMSGSPFLYGGDTIPMALLTGAAFALVSAAVLLGAGEAWPLRMFLRERTPQSPAGGHHVEWPLLLLFLLLAAGLTIVGVRYLNHRQQDARTAARAELEAIADLKVQQIVNWRKERLVDANWIRATPYGARRALDALAQPDSTRTRKMFTGWMDPLLAGGNYERVLLLDDQLNVQLVHPEIGSRTLSEVARGAAEQALRTRQVVMANLHRAPDDSRIHLSFMVPLVVRREGTNDNVPAAGLDASPADRGAGVLILQVDAYKFLFPLIQKWPMPSPTAETLLVQREGNEVLFLNELLHRKGTALTLRRPLDDPRLPAAMGLRGERGVQEGVDYRDVPVVATVRSVPDTPWLMVAKVDEIELYAPLREETLKVVGVLLSLLLTAALGISLLWRRRNEHFLHAQLAAEQERRVLAERFEHLMKNASDTILLADEQDRILEANDFALTLHGYSLAELRTMKLPDLRPPAARPGFARQAEVMAAMGHAVFETLHQRKDGSVFPVEVSSRLVEIGGTRYKLGILRDITQRKAHEAEIARLNRLYATLSQINQTIVRLESREAMFEAICRIMAEHGGFKVAWIGWLDRETHAVVPVARAGQEEGFVDRIKVYADERPEGQGPVGTCIREEKPSVFNDFVHDPRTLPWHEAALAHGLRSAVAMPVRYQGEVCGALAVLAEQPDVFQEKEVALLEEAALDVSFALDHLEIETRRRVAEADLRRSQAELLEAQRLTQMGNWEWNAMLGRATWSAELFRLYGRDPSLGPAGDVEVARYFTPESWVLLSAAKEQALKNGAPYECDAEVVRPDGTHRWVVSRGEAVRDASGKISGLRGTTQDITERKRVEEALAGEQHLLRTLVDLLPTLIFVKDAEGRFLLANEACARYMGAASPQELIGKTDAAFYPPEAAARFRLDELKVMQGDSLVDNEEGSELLGDDRRILLTTKIPFRNSAGEVIGLVGASLDITERKQAELALQESERKLREAQKLAQLGQWRWDVKSGAVEWSEEVFNIFRLDPNTFTPRIDSIMALSPWPGDRERDQELIRRTVASRAKGDYEQRFVRPDGSIGYYHSTFQGCYDAAGDLLAIVGTVLDITERKRAEELLRRSEAHLRTLVGTLPDLVWLKDTNGVYLACNPRLERLFGVSEAQIIGKTDRDFVDQELAEAFRAKDAAAMAAGKACVNEEEITFADDGHVELVETIKTPMYDSAGNILGVLGIARDITERKRAEESLRLFRTLIDRSSDSIEVIDPVTGRFLDANEKGYAELGYTREEFLALTVFEVDSGVSLATFMKNTPELQKVAFAVFESVHRRKDGTTFPVEVRLNYVHLDRGYIVSVARDITERKRLEQEQQSMEAQLRQQQKLESIGTLASGVAHEINNPINGVMNYAQLIQDRLPADSPLTEFAGEIIHETQRVATIVRNLLTFSRDEKQSHSPARLVDIVEGTLSLIRTVIRHDQITLHVNIPPELPELKCRSQQIQQVLMNLMTNARDALNERYPGHAPDKVLNVSAVLFEKEGRRWIRITVEDHGIGITPEVRERMFDPFFTTKPRDKGTGLGLAISHGIVKEHHGELTAESEPGKFTRMHLGLPVDNGWNV